MPNWSNNRNAVNSNTEWLPIGGLVFENSKNNYYESNVRNA